MLAGLPCCGTSPKCPDETDCRNGSLRNPRVDVDIDGDLGFSDVCYNGWKRRDITKYAGKQRNFVEYMRAIRIAISRYGYAKLQNVGIRSIHVVDSIKYLDNIDVYGLYCEDTGEVWIAAGYLEDVQQFECAGVESTSDMVRWVCHHEIASFIAAEYAIDKEAWSAYNPAPSKFTYGIRTILNGEQMDTRFSSDYNKNKQMAYARQGFVSSAAMNSFSDDISETWASMFFESNIDTTLNLSRGLYKKRCHLFDEWARKAGLVDADCLAAALVSNCP